MKLSRQLFLFAVWLMPFAVIAQTHHEKIDTTIVAKIRDEGFNRSQVMDILQMLTDVNGSRLSFSPGYKSAAAYAKKTMESWGLANVQFDTWGDVGKGWSIKKYHMHMLEPTYYPLVGYPKAWSPAVKGTVTGEVIYLNATTEDDLKKYKGKLKGKVIMMDLPPKISFAFEPGATRFNDSTLLRWANDVRSDRGFRFRPGT
ncbi:MAG: hypothetical protein HC859_13505 [Bacteroidia bacterium]|nr:hypothetical protein [Bacteroidia bacterium]